MVGALRPLPEGQALLQTEILGGVPVKKCQGSECPVCPSQCDPRSVPWSLYVPTSWERQCPWWMCTCILELDYLILHLTHQLILDKLLTFRASVSLSHLSVGILVHWLEGAPFKGLKLGCGPVPGGAASGKAH